MVVVDDGSTQDMGAARELTERAGHRFVSTENQGVSAARNLGVNLTDSPYLAFLDSDDHWLPGKLKAQLDLLEETGLAVCQTNEIWYRGGRRVNPGKRHRMTDGDLFERSCQAVCVSDSAVLVERRVFDEFGGFDPRYRVCEDFALWMRVAAHYRFGLVEEPLVVKYGGHADQLSKAYPAMDRFRLAALLELLLSDLLTPGQVETARRAALEKAKILATGARKKRLKSLPVWDCVAEGLAGKAPLAPLLEQVFETWPEGDSPAVTN